MLISTSFFIYIYSLSDDIVSFQTGVDSIYTACKNKGSTPTAKTPTAIVTAINSLKIGVGYIDIILTDIGNATVSDGGSAYYLNYVGGTGTISLSGITGILLISGSPTCIVNNVAKTLNTSTKLSVASTDTVKVSIGGSNKGGSYTEALNYSASATVRFYL